MQASAGKHAPIGHIDADCFYVSAERVRYEDLMGLPVGVLGNQGACVIAKSYEMKAAGVTTAMPIWEAMAKCPDGVYVKRDFAWYEVLSRQMLDIVKDESGKAEYYSIDEFFFDAFPPRGLDPGDHARRIRDRIAERVRVPVTVGIARTRTLAKLISDSAKPAGVAVLLDPAEEEALLARLPVSDITGIAARRAAKLAPWGIATCLDFARADRRLIRRLLTVDGERLWYELNGEPVTPIRTERPPHKLLGRGGSFGESTANPHVIFAWLCRNVERLIEELKYYQVLAGRVSVYVAYRDGRWRHARASFGTPTDCFDALLEDLSPCLRAAWIPRATATRMHVIADKLTRRRVSQLGLFDRPDEQARRVAEVKERINAKVGRWALRSAATLPLRGVYRDRSNYLEVCDIKGKMCF